MKPKAIRNLFGVEFAVQEPLDWWARHLNHELEVFPIQGTPFQATYCAHCHEAYIGPRGDG